MGNIQLLLPEGLLSALALLLLLADLWIPARHGKSLYHLGILCAALTLGMVGLSYSDPSRFQTLSSTLPSGAALWVVDPMSLFFKVLVLVATILALVLTLDYVAPSSSPAAPEGLCAPQAPVQRHLGTFSALVLLATMGMMLLVSSVDLLMIFLSLELISICSFILAGFERSSLKSSEGALKYFLIGAFSSALTLYGISLLYGATGTTSLLGLRSAPTAMFLMGMLLLIVGFGFKASIVPFHLWVPDAYEGAPTPVTAYLSIAPKIAALALLLRVFTTLAPRAGLDLTALFSFLAVITMTVGNLTALFQNNVKRLLAYSSIAQAGYMLIGFVAGGPMGVEGLLLYSLVYVFMNTGAFAVAIMLGNEDSYGLEAYDGLATRNFGVAVLMAFFLLSLAGIPPMAGFIAKFYVFAAAMESKLYALAVFGVLNSVVSVFYYLRIVYHMFFMPAKTAAPIRPGFYLYSGLTVAALGIILIGLYPDPFISAVRLSSTMLPKPGGAFLP